MSNFHILTLPETRFHSIPSTKSRPHSPTHLRLESLTRPHHRVEWLVKLSGKFHVGKSLKFNIIKFNKVSKLLSQLLVQVSRTLCQILVEFGTWTMDHLSIILNTLKFIHCWIFKTVLAPHGHSGQSHPLIPTITRPHPLSLRGAFYQSSNWKLFLTRLSSASLCPSCYIWRGR